MSHVGLKMVLYVGEKKLIVIKQKNRVVTQVVSTLVWNSWCLMSALCRFQVYPVFRSWFWSHSPNAHLLWSVLSRFFLHFGFTAAGSLHMHSRIVPHCKQHSSKEDDGEMHFKGMFLIQTSTHTPCWGVPIQSLQIMSTCPSPKMASQTEPGRLNEP